ncbi:MAG: hypothetical protein RSC93_09900 [Erysipelotrichaceae bacterium]
MNIKDYREKELKMYVIGCILLFISLTQNFMIYDIKLAEIVIKILNTSIISSSIYLISFVADSLFSNQFKEKLVYIFGICKKPGSEVFTSILKKNNDNRISTLKAQNYYKDIYQKMPIEAKQKQNYQNNCWYTIYSNYRNVKMIEISHRDFLLCRDIYCMNYIMIVFYVFGWLTEVLEFNKYFLFFLGLMIFCTNIACRIKAKRFVWNVIAYDLSIR